MTGTDDAGRFARRLLREMDSLWVFLAHHGVEPTNNRAERALRCGVLWRKRSLGTASDKGNRWVERILSLKETCRLTRQSLPTPCWWTPSPVSSMANNPISPGSTRG